jgi:hypothetical protein
MVCLSPRADSRDNQFGAAEVVNEYIAALEGVRSAEMLTQMKALPTARPVAERGSRAASAPLSPARKRERNGRAATTFAACPLHYFEKCAQAGAEDLRRRNVLSEQAFQTLKAVQDDSLLLAGDRSGPNARRADRKQ